MQNIIRSLIALVTVWLIGFGVVQITERMPHTATLLDAELLVLAVVAIFAAVRFRAVIAAWVFGAFAAYGASETRSRGLVIHAIRAGMNRFSHLPDEGDVRVNRSSRPS